MFIGSLAAAWRLRGVLPELSLWLLADAVLLVTAATGVAEDTLNLTRLTPLAVPAIALALAMPDGILASLGPRTGRRTGSASADLVG